VGVNTRTAAGGWSGFLCDANITAIRDYFVCLAPQAWTMALCSGCLRLLVQFYPSVLRVVVDLNRSQSWRWLPSSNFKKSASANASQLYHVCQIFLKVKKSEWFMKVGIQLLNE
jgi:hypothetical protein